MKQLPNFLTKCVRNSAICLDCGDEVESRSGHDFRSCKCGNLFVDGGLNYCRRGAKDFARVEDTSVYRRLYRKELVEDIIYWEQKVEEDKEYAVKYDAKPSKWNIEELEKRQMALEEYVSILDGQIIT